MKEILFKDEVIKHLLEGIDHLATDGMAERQKRTSVCVDSEDNSGRLYAMAF